MIPFEYNNQKYRLNFKYGVDDRERRYIVASIVVPEKQGSDQEVVIEGMSICAKEDNFNKEIGRQLAIKDLISCDYFAPRHADDEHWSFICGLKGAIQQAYYSRKRKEEK